jgi:hypothetical protein
MKQLFSKLIELVAKNTNATPRLHRELVPIRVSARSPLGSRTRREARSRTTEQGWRVTSFSGF